MVDDNGKGQTFLFIKVTVHVSLDLCIVSISNPGQLFATNSWTSLIVECSKRDIIIHSFFKQLALHKTILVGIIWSKSTHSCFMLPSAVSKYENDNVDQRVKQQTVVEVMRARKFKVFLTMSHQLALALAFFYILTVLGNLKEQGYGLNGSGFFH